MRAFERNQPDVILKVQFLGQLDPRWSTTPGCIVLCNAAVDVVILCTRVLFRT